MVRPLVVEEEEQEEGEDEDGDHDLILKKGLLMPLVRQTNIHSHILSYQLNDKEFIH